MNFEFEIQNEILKIKDRELFREVKEYNGFDFSSNDYLNLSKSSDLISAFKEGIELYGLGSTGSRLISGHRTVFEDLEKEFSEWICAESSLYLMNGYLANLGLIYTLGDLKTEIYTDRLNHASILDGIRISHSKKIYYNHNNYDHLEELLKRSKTQKKIIIAESLFSMDGDFCDLSRLIWLKKKYNTLLVIDEAHALGVFGEQGGGVSLENGDWNLKEIDIRLYTCGKSMGLQGALISCKKIFRTYFINKMRPFIYSTAPMPAIAHACKKSIELIKSMNSERKDLKRKWTYLSGKLKEIGLDVLNTRSQIIPILFENEKSVLEVSKFLNLKGFNVVAIRPPTVIQPRLRVSLNTGLRLGSIDSFLNYLREFM